MAVRLLPRRSTAAGAIPTTANLIDGEMAVNTTDRKVYVRVGAAVVQVANIAPTYVSVFDAAGNLRPLTINVANNTIPIFDASGNSRPLAASIT